MICTICGVEATSWKYLRNETVCPRCAWEYFGLSMNSDFDYSVKSLDGVVMNIKMGPHKFPHVISGTLPVVFDGLKIIQSVPLNMVRISSDGLHLPFEILRLCRDLMGSGRLFCNRCGKLILVEEVFHTHYGLAFCEECSVNVFDTNKDGVCVECRNDIHTNELK